MDVVETETEEEKKSPLPLEENKQPSKTKQLNKKKQPKDASRICKRFFHAGGDYGVFGLYHKGENHMIEVRRYKDIYKITVDDRSYDSK